MKEKTVEKKAIPLNPLDLAFVYWKLALAKGGWAIDATCGNGRDTVRLAPLILPGSGLIGLDIQEKAISLTQELLSTSPPSIPVHLFVQSHETFPSLAQQHPIRLIVYNLGYLPGGNKALTTLESTTLQSLQKALPLIIPGGLITVSCYSGHPEGEIEEKKCIEFCASLPKTTWTVSHHRWLNRDKAPSLLIIQRPY